MGNQQSVGWASVAALDREEVINAWFGNEIADDFYGRVEIAAGIGPEVDNNRIDFC